MINTIIDFETVIEAIDNGIKPSYLNKLQEIILKESWQGKTYAEIARTYNYESDYIKSAGCELWKLISQSFDQQVNKSNFIAFARRTIMASAQFNDKNLPHNYQTENSTTIVKKNNWTTAPDISHLLDRDDDIQPLVTWSQDHRCRCILISGMTGSGKTTLATKFAYKQQKEFEHIVWLSVQNAPPVETLLKICLKAFDSQAYTRYAADYVSFEALLVELVSYLRSHRCLLILDGLQEVLECTDSATYYRQNHEKYGQLIRSIITTNNQGLLVMTSRIKLKALNYYGHDKVHFLTLGNHHKVNIDNIVFSGFNKDNLQLKSTEICQYYLHNPQLLKIVTSNLRTLPEIDSEESIKNIASLEEIDNLLNLELKYLSRLEREIIHWFAIDCEVKTTESLILKIGTSASKIELLEALHNLMQRSLISKFDLTYKLAPLVKDYLQRKIIRLAVNSEQS